MRLAFVDPIDWDYTVSTVFDRPLGGSQSALCYLTTALARRGHQLFVFNNTQAVGRYLEVCCYDLVSATAEFLESLELDAIVVLNSPAIASAVRANMTHAPKLVLWTQHAADQPAVACLAEPQTRASYDLFVFVSQWQLAQYATQFHLRPAHSVVLRNAVGPSFEGLFAPGEQVSAAKSRAPTLAYTSTPFRGLDLLLDAFPMIRAAIPSVTLNVFSGLAVYQVPSEEDEVRFGHLYDRCRQTAGVVLRGNVAQPRLARELKQTTMLAYPNSFPETSCIAVMEAMAAGCQIVTTHAGALPETTAGFAKLVLADARRDSYLQRFSQACIELLSTHDDNHPTCGPQPSNVAVEAAFGEDHLQRQVAHASRCLSWDQRAGEWELQLTSLIDGVR